MVDWKKRIVSASIIIPILIYSLQYKIVTTAIALLTTFLIFQEYRILIENIKKQIFSKEISELVSKNYISLLIFFEHFFIVFFITKEIHLFVIFFFSSIQIIISNLILFVMNKEGHNLNILWITCAFQTDNGALFLGKLIGKTKLSKISPNKTWEGVLGAYLLNLVSCYFLLFLLKNGILFYKIYIGILYYLPFYEVKDLAIFSIFMSSFSIFGDFIESFIKRTADVKDSGNCVPGHGGILDRIDSLSFCSLGLFIYIQLSTGFQNYIIKN